jgi:hypothetical protein
MQSEPPAPSVTESASQGEAVEGRTGAVDAAGARPAEKAKFVDLLGVRYLHDKTSDGGDLYLTKYGMPLREHLEPESWFAKEWFEANRERLVGTSVVYRVPTRPIRNRILQLVVKWSRVGEEVPMDTFSINRFINAEFNSPFEEFSLLMELRAGRHGPPGIRIHTQKPLAIYVPPERLQLWETGRSESRIAAKIARNPGVELDILRQYVLLYGWIKGVDVVEAVSKWTSDPAEQTRMLGATTSLAIHELEHKGYRVADMKPVHIIVRTRPDGSLVRDATGQLVYALVDYELLHRTPEYEQSVRDSHRRHYLEHMARRFEDQKAKPLPPHLDAMNILGVDYIHGHAESTGGQLWVVGKDPDLFNYFLPERWRRTPKQALSASNEVFRTRTKDNINLVWRVSRVGAMPSPPESDPRAEEIRRHGYNSPFEEFALALEMSSAGVRTVYPRAIYKTGHKTARRQIADPRRYDALAHVVTLDGEAVLSPDHDYITVWGFWNGPDEYLAVRDGRYYRGVDAKRALAEGIISEEMVTDLLERARRRMRRCGVEDLRLKPDHLLISFDPENNLMRDTFGKPELRLCQFDMLRRV